MKIQALFLFLIAFITFSLPGLCQVKGDTTSISEQIKTERDNQLKDLNEKLKKNEEEVNRLTEKLNAADNRNSTDKEKIYDLEKLQIALDNRLKFLEEGPKTKINLNGQLAFTELLSIQRDIQPLDLFVSSQTFFTQLGNIGKIQNYSTFTNWKKDYDNWYNRQGKDDQMMEVINNSLNLISAVGSNVPLYGTMVATASSGITALVTAIGKKEKDLSEKTPAMLRLLNVTSQFEHQKAIIDHEWAQINKELEQLQKENAALLEDQMNYYGISMLEYKRKYLNATLDIDRETFKNECRKAISEKIMLQEKSQNTKGKWLGQVETYMYKVQSLRLRFGQLTSRMLVNMEQYENIISVYSDSTRFPAEFTTQINGLNNSLRTLKNKFYASYNPARYIEDSAVMYIERQ
jgi:chromosome segregation ATPase